MSINQSDPRLKPTNGPVNNGHANCDAHLADLWPLNQVGQQQTCALSAATLTLPRARLPSVSRPEAVYNSTYGMLASSLWSTLNGSARTLDRQSCLSSTLRRSHQHNGFGQSVAHQSLASRLNQLIEHRLRLAPFDAVIVTLFNSDSINTRTVNLKLHVSRSLVHDETAALFHPVLAARRRARIRAVASRSEQHQRRAADRTAV